VIHLPSPSALERKWYKSQCRSSRSYRPSRPAPSNPKHTRWCASAPTLAPAPRLCKLGRPRRRSLSGRHCYQQEAYWPSTSTREHASHWDRQNLWDRSDCRTIPIAPKVQDRLTIVRNDLEIVAALSPGLFFPLGRDTPCTHQIRAPIFDDDAIGRPGARNYGQTCQVRKYLGIVAHWSGILPGFYIPGSLKTYGQKKADV